MFCRVLHFYGMNYREVMGLPIRAFWLLNSNVVRLMAERDLRTLQVASSAQQQGEAISHIRENLVIELGEVVVMDPIASAVRDQDGFNELKAMTQ